jgi:Fic family protein
MRTYEKTHPWIRFEIDLTRAGYQLWMTLGEAVSKCEHIAGVPLRPSTAEKLHLIYLAKGIRGTTAIEGNTLSEEEVMERLEGNLPLPPSREYLGQEVDNILKGCNVINSNLMAGGTADLSLEEIKSFNKIVLDGLSLDQDIVPGEIRSFSVGVANYRGAPAEDCEYLLSRMCQWLNGLNHEQFKNTTALGIIRAVIAHIYIAWIHPFGDGNGRTARLVEFKTLLASGISTPAAHLLSNHYNLTRTDYYKQLDYSSKSGGNIIPFIQYALQGLVDGLREQIAHIQKQQLDIAWRDFVYDSFKDKSGPSCERRRKLVLDLTANIKAVPLSKLREISPRMTESYQGKTSRTVRRDVVELLAMKLIRRTPQGYVADSESMRSFLPERRSDDLNTVKKKED